MDELKRFLDGITPTLNTLWTEYQFPTSEFQSFHNDLTYFSVRLPLIGGFSAGKSSLVNTLLGEKLLSVAITPETCLPTELTYAEQESLTFHHPDKGPSPLTREQVKAPPLLPLSPGCWVEVATPSRILKALDGMTLVDMPGWESGIEQHANAIDHYLERSAAYCVVVSVDEGGLKASLKNIIKELAEHQKPMMLVLTKCDKKTTEEVDAVTRQVTTQIEDITGKPLLSVSQASRKTVGTWFDALQQLQPLNHHFLYQRVGVKALVMLQQLHRHLGCLLNDDDLSLESIAVKHEALRQQVQACQDELATLRYSLSTQIEPICRFIGEEFENSLKGDVENLVRTLLYGGDINNSVGTSLRLAYTKGIEQKLKPLVQHKLASLHHLDADAPQGLRVEHRFTINQTNDHVSDITGHLLTLAVTALTRIPALMFFAPVIKSVLNALFSSASKEIAERQQQDEARHYVLATLLPQLRTQALAAVSEGVQKSVVQILDNVSQQVEADRQKLELALAQVAADLSLAGAAEQARKADYADTREQVAQMISALEAFEHA